MINLDIMHSRPGIYRVAQKIGYFFVEVDDKGRCYQLKPRTWERDGELVAGGWDLSLLRRIDGPYKKPELSTLPPLTN